MLRSRWIFRVTFAASAVLMSGAGQYRRHQPVHLTQRIYFFSSIPDRGDERENFDIALCITRNYNMTLKFKVELIQEPDGGYIANVPALPGCHTQGDSFDETIENIKDAIQLYLDVLYEESTSTLSKSHSQIVEVSV